MAAADTEVDPAVLAKFAQKLAGNEKKYRDRAVKKLRKWMGMRSQQKNGGFTEYDFLKIWKGLHYCMWMSDKPLIQEELAVALSELVHCFSDPQYTVQFVSAFFITESREWFNIDRLRLDKFMMLIRKFLRQTFIFLSKRGWEKELVSQVLAVLSASVISGQTSESPEGLKLHIADIYIDELTVAGAEDLEKEQFSQLLDPYCLFITRTKSQPAVKRVIKEVFFPLIDMEIERGEEKEEDDEEKEEDDEEKEEDDEEEEEDEDEEKSPQWNVDFKHLADRLFELASGKECPSKNRKSIYSLVKTFRNLSEGILPEVKELDDEPEGERINYEKAVQRLQNFESKILKKTGKFKPEKRKKSKTETENEPEAPPAKKKKSVKQLNGVNTSEEANGEEAEQAQTTESGKKKKKNKVHEMNPAKKAMLEKKKKKKNSAEESGDTETVVVLSAADGSSKTVEKEKQVVELAALRQELSQKTTDTNLFEGGFFDSDEEDEAPKVKTKKKKNKKSTQGTAVENLENSSPKEDSESPVPGKMTRKKKKKQLENVIVTEATPVADDELGSIKIAKKKKKKAAENAASVEESQGEVSAIVSPVNSAKKKKQKRKSIGNDSQLEGGVNGSVNDIESSELETPKTKKLKKAKQKSKDSPKANSSGDLEEGEVEILVPNKKYKGQFKEAFEKEMKKSLGKGKSPKVKNDFVNFETGAKTPPAFVRRVLTKLSTPKTEPRKKLQKELLMEKAGSVPDKKRRVSFVLERNMAQDFEDSLTLSPVVPFDPENQPDRTILKAKATKECKKLFQRSKAADFF